VFGSSEQGPVDAFITEALRFFGDPQPSVGTEWSKGERLADLISAQRNLVILDALETLLVPPQDALTQGGTLNHPAITALVKSLARKNKGLLVVTTRLSLADVSHIGEPSVHAIDLEDLSESDAVLYLQKLGVRGDVADLERLAEACGWHALLLTLMGRYLVALYGGDVRQAHRIRLSNWPKTAQRVAAVLA